MEPKTIKKNIFVWRTLPQEEILSWNERLHNPIAVVPEAGFLLATRYVWNL